MSSPQSAQRTQRISLEMSGPTNDHAVPEAAATLHSHLTREVIGAAIEVHKALGPGLLEAAYQACLCHELALRGIPFEREVPFPVRYKSISLDAGLRIDLVVEDRIVLEL